MVSLKIKGINIIFMLIILMFLLIFSINFFLIFLFILIDIIKYKSDLNLIIERFNFFTLKKQNVLIHSASCGESKISHSINKIKKINAILSVTTPTGFNLIRKYTDNVFLKPYDEIFSMLIMFIIIRPKTLIIIERDFWPFYILFAKIFNCKIYFINYKIKNKITDYIHYVIADKIYTIDKINKGKYEYLGDLKILNCNYKLKKKSNKIIFIVIASAGQNELPIHKKIINNLLNYKNIKIIYVPRHLNWKKNFKRNFKF